WCRRRKDGGRDSLRERRASGEHQPGYAGEEDRLALHTPMIVRTIEISGGAPSATANPISEFLTVSLAPIFCPPSLPAVTPRTPPTTSIRSETAPMINSSASFALLIMSMTWFMYLPPFVALVISRIVDKSLNR